MDEIFHPFYPLLESQFGVSCVLKFTTAVAGRAKAGPRERERERERERGQGLESNFMDYWTGWHCI